MWLISSAILPAIAEEGVPSLLLSRTNAPSLNPTSHISSQSYLHRLTLGRRRFSTISLVTKCHHPRFEANYCSLIRITFIPLYLK